MGRVNVAMLGFHIDLYLGVIWAEMALATGLRLACFHDGELVTSMTTRATSFAAVKINTPHTYIGPSFRI